MLSLQLTLMRVVDPDLLARLEAATDPSADRTDADAVLRLLALADEGDARFELLFNVAALTDPDGKAHASVGRLVPTPTATTMAAAGTPTVRFERIFDGWSVDTTRSDGTDALQLDVALDTKSQEGEPLQLDWTGTVPAGHSVLRPADHLLLLVTTAPSTGLTAAVDERAAARERVDARLGDYDLRRRRERQRALEDLLGSHGA